MSRLKTVPDWPVGTAVKMIDCAEADDNQGRIWKTRSEAWLLGGHTPVVMLEGKTGCFDANRLQKVSVQSEPFAGINSGERCISCGMDWPGHKQDCKADPKWQDGRE